MCMGYQFDSFTLINHSNSFERTVKLFIISSVCERNYVRTVL